MHLITGGSGFVGSNIARLLRRRGEDVRVLDLWKADDLPEGVEFVHADVTDPAAVAKAMTGVRYVHHNAALVPLAKAGKAYWTVNVDGTKIVLDAARKAGVELFVHMSTSSVFGWPDSLPITPGTPLRPIEAYGRSKLAGEELVRHASAQGLRTCIIRPRTVIGCGRLGIFQILFEWIRDGANVYVIGKGDFPYQFVHVDDLVESSVRAALGAIEGAYNMGTPDFGTLRGDLEYLCEHAGTGSRVKSLPVGLTIGALRILDWLRLSPLGPWHYLTYHKPMHFDMEPVRAAFGWVPRHSNREMLTSSYDWFIANYDEVASKRGSSAHTKPVRQKILRILKAIS